MELYTFNRKSWHVILFTFLWGYNPVYKHKTMCPYFWKGILGIIISPVLILLQILSYLVDKLDDFTTYFKDKRILRIATEIAPKLEKVKVWDLDTVKKFVQDTGNQKYDVYCKAVWVQWPERDRYIYTNIIWDALQSLSWDVHWEDEKIAVEKFDAKEAFKEKYFIDFDKIRNSPIFAKLSAILFTIVVIVVLAILGWLLWIWIFDYYDNFIMIMKGIGYFLIAGVIGGLGFLLIRFLWTIFGGMLPDNPKYTILKNIWKGVEWVFNGIGKIFLIIIDMIVNTYRRSCPIITWKE